MTVALASAGCQYGSITIPTGATSAVATINAVGAGAHLIRLGDNSSDATGTANINCAYIQQTSGTQITATRAASSASQTVTVYFCITDGDPTNLVNSVQQGTIFMGTGATGTAVISSVSLTAAVAHYLGCAVNSASGINNTTQWASLTLAAALVTATVNTIAGVNQLTVAFIVIEYKAAALQSNVQAVSDSASPGATTRTHAITSVTLANALLIYAGQQASGGTYSASLQYGRLTAVNTVTIGTQSAPFITLVYNFFIVEFVAALVETAAQRGLITITAGTTGNAALSPTYTLADMMTTYGGNSSTGTVQNTRQGGISASIASQQTGRFAATATGAIAWEAIGLNPANNVVILCSQWIPSFADFARRPLRFLAAGRQLGPQNIIFKENINLDKWNPQYPDFTRNKPTQKPMRYDVGPISEVFPAFVSPDKWIPRFEDFTRLHKRVVAAGWQQGPIDIIFAEKINPDKWLPVTREFTRRPVPLATGFTQGPVSPTFRENIFIDKWVPSFADFTRKALRALDVGHTVSSIATIFKETINLDKWNPSAGVPQRVMKPITAETNVVVFTPPPSLSADKWMPSYADFTRRLPGTFGAGYVIGPISPIFAETVYPDKWMPSYPDFARRPARPLDTGIQVGALLTLFKETVNFDKWGPSFPDFARRALRPLDTGFAVSAIATTFKETILFDKWGPVFADFTRRAITPLRTGFTSGPISNVFAPTVNLDKWLPSFADIVRKLPRALDVGFSIGAIATTFKEAINYDKWGPLFAERTRRPARAVDVGFTIGPVNIVYRESIFLDKWNPDFPAFTRRPKRALDVGYAVGALNIVFPEKVNLDKWNPDFPPITRKALRALDTGYQQGPVSNIFKPPAPLPDKWMPEFPAFARAAKRPLDTGIEDSILDVAWFIGRIGKLIHLRRKKRILFPDAKNDSIAPAGHSLTLEPEPKQTTLLLKKKNRII